MGNRLIEAIYLEPVTENEINTLIKSIKGYSKTVWQHEFHVPEDIFWNSDQATDPYLQFVSYPRNFP